MGAVCVFLGFSGSGFLKKDWVYAFTVKMVTKRKVRVAILRFIPASGAFFYGV